MNIYTKVLVGIAVFSAALVVWFLAAARLAKAVTDRGDYRSGDALEVKIQNESNKAICFSSCFPFYLEKQNSEAWQDYVYSECDEIDFADRCVDADGFKKFQLFLDEAESGVHRLKIPICVGCAAGQQFVANASIFSNTFNVK